MRGRSVVTLLGIVRSSSQLDRENNRIETVVQYRREAWDNKRMNCTSEVRAPRWK